LNWHYLFDKTAAHQHLRHSGLVAHNPLAVVLGPLEVVLDPHDEVQSNQQNNNNNNNNITTTICTVQDGEALMSRLLLLLQAQWVLLLLQKLFLEELRREQTRHLRSLPLK
jgi:hypothetical protein